MLAGVGFFAGLCYIYVVAREAAKGQIRLSSWERLEPGTQSHGSLNVQQYQAFLRIAGLSKVSLRFKTARFFSMQMNADGGK